MGTIAGVVAKVLSTLGVAGGLALTLAVPRIAARTDEGNETRVSPAGDNGTPEAPTTERVVEALRARERQQAAVARLGQQALGDLDLGALMDGSVRIVADTLNTELAEVLELLPCGMVLLLRAGVGWSPGLVGRATVGADAESPAGFTLLSRHPVIVEDLSADARFSGPTLLRDHRVVSGMSVIISGSARPFGVLGAYSRGQRVFTQDDVNFLQSVANVLGAAVERRHADEFHSHLAAIVQSSDDAIFSKTLGGSITTWNPAAERLYAYSAAEVIGRSVSILIPPERRDELPAILARLKRGEPVEHQETVRIRKDGKRIEVSVSISPIRDATGRITGASTIARDITERNRSRRGQALLAEAGSVLASSLDYEETLTSVARVAVAHIADWCTVHVVTTDGVLKPMAVAHRDPARLQQVRELEERYSADPNACRGMPNVLRTGRSELFAEIPDSLLTAIARDREHLRALREIGMVSAMVVPMRARGRILGTITLVTTEPGRRYDATDLALAEALCHLAGLAVDNARLYRDAQEAIRARDDFLSVAAHELRTPMTSLRGFAQLAVRHFMREEGFDREESLQALLMVDHHSKKLSNLISQLLDVCRLEARRLTLDRRVVDLARMAEEVVVAARQNADGHDITVSTPASAMALVDPMLVEQVLNNLIDNAIRYSPYGGAIHLEVSTPDCGTVRVAVRDHGEGIATEHLDRIFDCHYQASSGKGFGGLGLGLHISREIVALHDGRIHVERPAGGGSLFVVTVPSGFGEGRDELRQHPS